MLNLSITRYVTGDSLVNHELDLDPAILGTTFPGLVRLNRAGFSGAKRVD